MRRCRLLVFAVTMYPIINDRIHRTREYYCHFVPAENPGFVIALAVLGHHIPCVIIVVVYVVVFIEIRKLFKTPRPRDNSTRLEFTHLNQSLDWTYIHSTGA